MESILKQMIDEHQIENDQDRRNVVKEVIQEIVLCGLSRIGFFKEAAFYGGTALRIFYELDRFSEDLDFSLFEVSHEFSFDKYVPGLENELSSYGLNLEISIKEKVNDSTIKSAFVKGNTKELVLKFFENDPTTSIINKNELVKIKFEVDTCPPPFATFEHKYKQLPIPYEVALYDLPSLFAGKVHAVLCRSWKSRVKGRDLYDFAFYISKKTPINLKHLNSRLIDSGFITSNRELTLDDLKDKLKERFNSIDYKSAKEDVINFVKYPSKIEIWSKDYFCSLAEEIKQ
jgi:predicted nucleotidyltransferase component of viral defense system